MKLSQGSRCMIGVRHLNNPDRGSKTCEDYAFCRESYGWKFLRFSRRLVYRFSDGATNYQRRLLFEASSGPSKSSLSFNTTRSISQKRLSPPRQRASAHRRCDTRNIGGNALGSTATSLLQSWAGARRFLSARPTQRGPRRRKVWSQQLN